MSFHKKRLGIGIVSFICFSVIISSIPYMSDLNNPNMDIELNFDGKRAKHHIENQTSIGYRIPGSVESRKFRNYTKTFFKTHTNFSRFIHNFTVNSIECKNLLFKMNEEEKHIIIFSTHYDTRAKATKESGSKSPILGAVDGASGVSVLLELARSLSKRADDLKVQIWFLFFDAEDQGEDEEAALDGWDWCEGSTAFAKDITHYFDSKKETIDGVINVDMVGVNGMKMIADSNSDIHLHEAIFRSGRNLGYAQSFPVYQLPKKITDDHLAFKNIAPVCLIMSEFLFSSYHHTTKDTLDLIDSYALGIIGETLEIFIYNTYHEKSKSLIDVSLWLEKGIHNIFLLLLIMLLGSLAIVGISWGLSKKEVF